jgi:RND family efflux transporter MFP subunit
MQKKKKTWIIITIIFLLIILIAGAIIRIKQNAAEATKKPSMITNIITGKAVRGVMVQKESLTGDILPIQQANIFSKVNGNIEKIFVNIGDYVHQGQVLALIDTTLYSQNAKQAYSSYLQATANFENAKLNYERNKALLDQKLISKQDADNSKTAFDIAQSQKDASLANYTNAATQLGYCKITAPFSGYITKRNFDAGVYVTSSAISSSSILFILMDLEKIKANINLPEKDVPLLKRILDIKVSADALPNEEFDAKINKISEAVDVSTRTMQVEIYIENAAKKLKPGMFANISIIIDKKENTLILPNEVVQNDQYGDFIFIINSDNTVTKKYVQLGIKQDNKVEVLSGIEENDLIVFTGQSLVKDGSKVKISKN